jgi:hypothetical protein
MVFIVAPFLSSNATLEIVKMFYGPEEKGSAS